MSNGWVWDFRYAARVLRRRPGFALAAVGTLALGIAVTTAIASVVYDVLLRPLSYPEPEELVVVWENDRATGTQREAASLPDFIDFEARSTTLSQMAAFRERPVSLTGQGREPSHLRAVEGTHDLISLLGTPLAFGRSPTAEESVPGAEPVVVLGHAFWRTEFGADPTVLDQMVLLDEVPFRVVGVLGEEPEFPARADVWLALREDSETLPRYTHPITVIARLGAESSVPAAQSEMTTIAADLEATYPENAGRGAFVEPLHTVLRGSVRSPLTALFLGALVVLLIACVNVSNLVLVHAASRSHEVTVAAALGAAPSRIARRFIAEGVLITSTALFAGIVLSFGGVRLIQIFAPPEVREMSLSLQLPVLLAALAVGAVVGLLFGVFPARRTVAASLTAGLADRGSGHTRVGKTRIRDLMIVGQSALAASVLVGASLFTESLSALRSVDPGFETRSILRAQFELPSTRYPRDFSVYPNWVEINGFSRTLLERLGAVPGVESVALSSNHPLDPGFTNSFRVVGRVAAADQGELTTRMVSDNYFATVGTQIVRGRGFLPGDDAQSPMVILLNQAAVDRYFADENVEGLRIALWGFEREVVGVVENERMAGVDQAAPPAMYLPLHQAPPRGAQTILMRTGVDPTSRISAVRQVVADLDSQIAVFNVATMEATARDALARWSFTSLLLSGFGALALLLAAIGLHGVLAYGVEQRSHELGIRIALGATRERVLRMVMGKGMGLVAAGLALGLVVAVPIARRFSTLLVETTPTEPSSYLFTACVLTLVGLAACARPALRATGMDPVEALRSD